ncbi:hypothetical protein H5410_019303 [Solanum commersonii]|uniref:Uncharacterized protein n=1 Tax=Solanum commersonii TaxID=4109 RepID=A0A9J6A5Y3_SOLCO|nr:hypothetical protein H5410_019303 [Solanum commersonii]
MCTAIWPSPLVSELWKEKMDRGGNGWSLSSCTYGYTLAVIVIILTCHLLNSRLPFALSFLSVVFGFRERSAANPHAQSNGHPDVAPSAPSDVSSSYYILSLLSISTVDAIEIVNAISRGEDIPTTIIGVDDTSDDRVRALARITNASYLIVGGEITVRNVHVESPFPSAALICGARTTLKYCSMSQRSSSLGISNPVEWLWFRDSSLESPGETFGSRTGNLSPQQAPQFDPVRHAFNLSTIEHPHMSANH